MVEYLLAAIIGYGLGSIPFGLVLSKMAGYGDIRSIGSGNIGATNVLRTGNKKLAALTLALDSGKGAIAVLLVKLIFSGNLDAAIITGFCAILGHVFPVWLKFKGGKGVATTLGMLLALTPSIGIIACATWLGMAYLFKYSSLSALIAVLTAPLTAYILHGNINLALACLGITIIVWVKHRSNIQRLLAGEEPKIGDKKK